jgi:hypothetical protein
MRSKLLQMLTVLGAVTILVLAANTVAFAASGKGFIGKVNVTKKQTTLKRTRPGTVLSLVAKPGSPALAVNSGVKVGNLNADLLDGLDSSQLQSRSYVYTASVSNQNIVAVTAPVPAGTYLVSYSAFFGDPFNKTIATGTECYVTDATPNYVAYSSANNAAGSVYLPAQSGSGVATRSGSSNIVLHCDVSGAVHFSTQALIPIQLVLTPTTVAGSGTLPAARTAPSARSGN